MGRVRVQLSLLATVVAACLAAAGPEAPLDLKSVLEEYAARLDGVGLSGAFLVAKNGDVLLSSAYGFANRERQVRNTVDTVFPVGSITKQFTAAAILRLEMDGKLSVSDPITKYFPETPADKQPITLHHLLTHSSGLNDGFGEDREPVSRDEIVRRVLKSPLNWAPGSKYLYSNAGYSLLAAVVELVSGEPWERYLHDHLFVPAGMSRTGCIIPKWRPEELPHGYDGDEDKGTFQEEFGPDGPYWNLKGNGGIASTVGDMYRWHLALLGDSVLSAVAKKKAFTPYVREGDGAPSFYGYGWALFKTPRGTNLITHNGGNGIFSADLLRYVDEGVFVYGASNVAEIPAWQVTPHLAAIVFGGTVSPPPRVKSIDPVRLASLEGSYRLPSGSGLRVTRRSTHLVITPESQGAVEALTSNPPQVQQRLAKLSERTAALLKVVDSDGADKNAGRFGVGPMFFGRERQRHQDLVRELGQLRKVEVLGTLPGPEGRGSTLVRFTFEHGMRLTRYVWSEEMELIFAGPLPEPLGIGAFPESDWRFFIYDLATGAVRHIEVVQPTGGPPEALLIGDSQSRSRAVRERP
jgi:CubicO group peptidase (beta-lactamase class C family)